MNTINNTYTNSSLLSQTTGSAALNKTEDKALADSDKKTVRLESSDIVVSSRAQKLKALADEFFAGGLKGADVAALKERAFEYGLISEGQFNRLTVGTTNGLQEGEKTTQSLAEELEKVSKELEKRNKEVPEDKRQDVSKITSVLNRVANLLKDPETAITKQQFDKEIEAAMKDLNDIIDSNTFGNLPLKERVTMTNSASALAVIESLAPRAPTNDKVNQYLANSFA